MEHQIIRFKFLDLLRRVSVVSLLPWWVVGSILIVPRSTVHVITSRSALMLIFSASSATTGLKIFCQSSHLTLTLHTSLLLKNHQKERRKKMRTQISWNKNQQESKEKERSSEGNEAYESKRESRRAEHGLGKRWRDKAWLSDCTSGHVVAVRYISHDSCTTATRTIVKKTPKTHQKNPLFFFPLKTPFPSPPPLSDIPSSSLQIHTHLSTKHTPQSHSLISIQRTNSTTQLLQKTSCVSQNNPEISA